MGKPKKGKKRRQEEEFGDDIDIDPIAQAAALEGDDFGQSLPASKGKKGKKKKKDDWEDEVAEEISALSLESEEKLNGKLEESGSQLKGKKDKKKGKKVDIEDSNSSDDLEDMDGIVLAAAGKKKGISAISAFQMLDVEEPDMSESESEGESKSKSEKDLPKQRSVEDESSGDDIAVQAKQQKKSKKDKKKGKKKDEDIDAILAELEGSNAEKGTGKKGKKKKQGEAAPELENEDKMDTEENQTNGKTAPVASEGLELYDIENMTQEEIAKMLGGDTDEEEDRKKKKKEKKKKKKKGQIDEAADMEGDEGGEEDEEGGTVKTAAQKRKDKKERQRQQKLLEKKKQTDKKKTTQEEVQEEDVAKTEEASKPALEEKEVEDKDEDEEDDKKSKKDRDRRKKKEKEEKKKKPASAQIKAMQEALARAKEEEERMKREAEEKEKRREEAIKAKLEKERRDKEKKERDKQKKKEKIEKLKQEGKYLTAKQKEAQRRAQQMLEAMRAQGIKVPDVAKTESEDKKPKRIIYDSKKKRKPQQSKDVTTPSEETKELTPETPPETEVKQLEDKSQGAADEDVKDSWDAEDDVKDEWDASDTEEESDQEAPKGEIKVSDKTEEADEESEEEASDSEEESEEEESEETDSSEYSSDEESDDGMTSAEKDRERALARIQKRHDEAEAKRTVDKLRAPVVCVLGHVDTGKTKILDKLRRTHVQDGEAGGITQQIGATNVPVSCIQEQTKMCKEFVKKGLQLPGLLIIDTPGHESFSNLRTRGSSLCDIAILVIDIMHGLEPQTIESLNLLKNGKTPFVVALNKIDRLYQWQSNPHSDVRNTLNKQKPNTKLEFEERAQIAITQLAEQGLNATLFYENKNPKEYISLVPTSAHSGDGMGNLIALICELSQTMLAKRVSFSEELQATVMEVKALPGLGTTIDVILVNGSVQEGETIIVAGTEGPIVTTIRGLLMPQPLKELRVKNAYQKHKEVVAAQGVKIIAKELDHALAGLPMHVAKKPDEVDVYKEEIAGAIKDILAGIKVQERGVFVQASTIGSLEALLEFLRTSKINYAGINIGPVHKKDIMRASVMLEHDSQYAVILAFDVKVERDAQELADSLGVRIFNADIIYHLFDQFMAYRAELKRKKQEEFKYIAVFPCKVRILPQFIFNTRDPIVVGVVVEAGFIKVGTPLCVPNKDFVEIGRVVSIENNHKPVDVAKKGTEVCIKVEPVPGDAPKMLGRHFDETDLLVSKISRQSIDAVKDYFREEMGKGDWQLIMELKKTFQIL